LKEKDVRKETKAVPPGGDALMRAFEEFKAANDARLEAIERKRSDVLLEEKVDRIDRAVAEQKALIERAALNGRRPGLSADPLQSEHKSAWSAYMRRGDLSALAPAHVRAVREAGGDISVSWVRCARIGGDAWGPGEPPVAEGAEAYQLDILDGPDIVRSVVTFAPSYVYTAVQQSADFGAPASSLRLRVAQLDSSRAPGLNTETTITL
jgi:hypothetical protein